MSGVAIPYEHSAVKPLACYRNGWVLIKRNYWTYFGVACIGVLVASAVPFGILMGPMFCGIYYCYLRGLAGKPVEIADVFRGFENALQSIIAGLLMMIPGFLLAIPFTLVIMFRMLLVTRQLPLMGQDGRAVMPSLFAHLAIEILLLSALLFLCIIPLSALMAFAFPLVVDKHLSGIDAVSLSIRAGWASFLPLMGLCMLNMVLGMLGVLFCYVGAFFLLPLSMAANVIAYRQVFPSAGA